MPAPQPASIVISVNGTPLASDAMRLFQSLDVDLGVGMQAAFRLRFSLGQNSDGQWGPLGEDLFDPSTAFRFEGKVGNNSQPILNAVLTQFKMNYNANPCDSSLELSGSDELERLKKETKRNSHNGQSLPVIVANIFNQYGIQPPLSGVPDKGVPNPQRHVRMQAGNQNDLEFLRERAEENACELYVEPEKFRTRGHFERLELNQATPQLNGLVFNQPGQSETRNAGFYYDLNGPTKVVGRLLNARGEKETEVTCDLRTQVSGLDKRLLGPSDLAATKVVERHGRETRAELQDLCEAVLRRNSWVVVGKGEVDTSTYGDVLLPYRALPVSGMGKVFDGTYMVWKATHTFKRDLYCQRFELRRRLQN